MANAYEIADQTYISQMEARVYVRLQDNWDTESIADYLDISESTVWSYKYRVQEKAERAFRTVNLAVSDDEGLRELRKPEDIIEQTFLKSKVSGNDNNKGSNKLVLMAQALRAYDDGVGIPTIATDLNVPEDWVDELLGEAHAIQGRAERTTRRVSTSLTPDIDESGTFSANKSSEPTFGFEESPMSQKEVEEMMRVSMNDNRLTVWEVQKETTPDWDNVRAAHDYTSWRLTQAPIDMPDRLNGWELKQTPDGYSYNAPDHIHHTPQAPNNPPMHGIYLRVWHQRNRIGFEVKYINNHTGDSWHLTEDGDQRETSGETATIPVDSMQDVESIFKMFVDEARKLATN